MTASAMRFFIDDFLNCLPVVTITLMTLIVSLYVWVGAEINASNDGCLEVLCIDRI